MIALQCHQLVGRGLQCAPRGSQFVIEQTSLLPRLGKQRLQLLVVIIQGLGPTLIFLVLLGQCLQLLLLLLRAGLLLGLEDKPPAAYRQQQQTQS